jgi:hypothetical protein
MKTTEATQPSTKEQHINPYDIQNRRTTSPNTPRNKKKQQATLSQDKPNISINTTAHNNHSTKRQQRKGQ